MPACDTGRQTDTLARYQSRESAANLSSSFLVFAARQCPTSQNTLFCSPWACASPLGAYDSYQSSRRGSLYTATESEGQDSLVARMQTILCLVSHYQTEPCAESRYNLNVPSLSCSRAMRAPGAQPQPDRESLQWNWDWTKARPTSKRQERG